MFWYHVPIKEREFFLEENGYANHEEWNDDWEFQRNNQSFWLGDFADKSWESQYQAQS